VRGEQCHCQPCPCREERLEKELTVPTRGVEKRTEVG
jgi:hypothetical protein